ncbi:basic helix-loop-helix ARNT-like protein 1 isoform X3 [Mytilus galloprovincialis]
MELATHTPSKKRKGSESMFNDFEEEDESVDSGDVRFSRQNHSEIEKRRRDKMNAYITELSSLLPMCNAMNRKLDKLTVLRMAVQHLKSLRGATTTITEASQRPSFLSEDVLKSLILDVAEGFLFVVSCDRARILYVSESVGEFLNYSRNDLIGQSLFDYLHPRDMNKVKEQLSSSDMSPRERFIDSRTMMPVKTELLQRPTHLCSGARRSFFCRMKTGNKLDMCSQLKLEKDEPDMVTRKKKSVSDRKSFTVIHCTGYLKSWPTSKMDLNEQDETDDCSLSCLVAVGRVKTASRQQQIVKDYESIHVRPVKYVSRHGLDGKFTYIDQGATELIGYLQQELLGTSVYEYYHQDDMADMAEVHRQVLKTKEKTTTNVYRFKAKNGSFLHLRSDMFSFVNPWTKDVEYIVSTNTIIPQQEVSSSGQAADAGGVTLETFNDAWDESDSCLESFERKEKKKSSLPASVRLAPARIGRQIAEEIIDMQRIPNSPLADSTNNATQSSVPEMPKARSSHASPTNGRTSPRVPRNGLTHHPDTASSTVVPSAQETNLLENVIAEQQVFEDLNISGNDGNDEAAMSIIMSLLEADAGLGGPIDFNDLPWPL